MNKNERELLIESFLWHIKGCNTCADMAMRAMAALVGVGPDESEEMNAFRLDIIESVAVRVGSAVMLGISDCTKMKVR
jgi:hypothetical protein